MLPSGRLAQPDKPHASARVTLAVTRRHRRDARLHRFAMDRGYNNAEVGPVERLIVAEDPFDEVEARGQTAIGVHIEKAIGKRGAESFARQGEILGQLALGL